MIFSRVEEVGSVVSFPDVAVKKRSAVRILVRYRWFPASEHEAPEHAAQLVFFA